MLASGSESVIGMIGGGSTSTTSPTMVTGWHVLKVEGYSKTKGLDAGKGIKSSTFTIGGHSWYIRYFPGSFGSTTGAWVGVDLNLHHPLPSGEVLTQFKFSLLDKAGEPVSSPLCNTQTNHIRIFSSKTMSMGNPFFITNNSLESSYLKDDSFKIRCDLTVINDIHAEDTTVEPAVTAVPPPDLHRHLGELLDSQVAGDIVFEVGGQLFTAHRNVLAARSSVFMAQLFGPMKEKTTGHVTIDDMEARVFKVMLRFVYTDLLPDMEEDDETVMSQHLLVAADRYDMERLKLICEDILRKRIDADIVATTLVLAEQHGCCGLKNACLKFLMSPGNLKTVMASDSFQYLKNSCTSLLEELLAKVAP